MAFSLHKRLSGPHLIIISYAEALSMLEQFAGEDKKTLDKELSTILSLMIQSYFSRHEVTMAESVDQRMYRLLEENQFADFDNSEVAWHITMSIIKTTQMFLPGFSAHDQYDCQGILDIQMKDRSTAIIEIHPMVFDRFTQPKTT